MATVQLVPQPDRRFETAAELKAGDDVVGYGTLAEVEAQDGLVLVRRKVSLIPDRWPASAIVQVKTKPKRWSRTITQVTSDPETATFWRGLTGEHFVDAGTTSEHGEVVEA